MVRVLFLLMLVSACGGPRRLTAPGAMTDMLNQSLARTTAANRALSELLPMLRLDGLKFNLAASELGKTFSVEANDTKGRPKDIEYQPIQGGWLAFVTVERPDELEAQMRQLQTVSVEATAENEKLPVAMREAKLAAVEKVVERALGAERTGIISGTVTVTELRYLLPEGPEAPSTVTVQLSGLAKVVSREALPPTGAESIADVVLDGHVRAGLWSEALVSVETFLKAYPKHLKYRVLQAALHVQMDEVKKAQSALKDSMRKVSWDDAQDALADAEPFVGPDLVDSVETLALEAGLIAPPTVGAPPRAVIREDPSPGANRPKKRKRRRRRKR